MTEIVVPGAVTLLPAAPNPGSDTQVDFDAKAYALVEAQIGMVPEINDLAAKTHQNAVAVHERAQAADSAKTAAVEAAALAVPAASTASSARFAAEQARDDAEAFAAELDPVVLARLTMPRFHAYVWTGPNTPEGDIPSSGQELSDLAYPTMRADVVASQFYTTEADWQANPYKRTTHWSLGDGTTTTGSWMRPPDKNKVRPGSVGPVYASGVGLSDPLLGTGVIDQMRNITGDFRGRLVSSGSAGAVEGGTGAFTKTRFDVGSTGALSMPDVITHVDVMTFNASAALPAGTTSDPVTGAFQPKTWFGVWMIRMYGRVTNAGALNAPALSGRMDLIDARVAALEGGGTEQDVLASRAASTAYQAPANRWRKVSIKGSGTSVIQVSPNGTSWINKATVTQGVDMIVPAAWFYRVNGAATIAYWTEG